MADTKQIDWGDGTGEKITVTAASFVGNKGLQISSPENVKVAPRSKTIVLKSKTDPTKVARINVVQEKAVYTYDFSLAASVATIAAKGGTSAITAQLKTYRNGNLISTETVTPVLFGSASGFSISGTTVTASNRTTVVGAERSITVTGKYSGTYDGQEVSATVVVKQEANIATYGTITISGGTVADIPASGGKISSMSGISASQTVSYTSGATRDGNVSISYSSAVSASSLGTTVKARTKVGTLTATASGEGSKSATKSLDVYQQANSATYGNLVGGSASASDIPASGGTRTATVVNATQTVSFTSGSERAGTVTYTQSDAISGSNLGTTLKSRTKLGTIEVSFTGEGGKTSSTSCDVYQQANSIDSYNYGSWNIAISANPTTIAYGGGTSTISASCTRSKTPVYTSGATGTAGTESATPTISGSATGFTLSGTTVTASANSWAASRSIVVTASYSGATSKSVTITQSAAPASISLNKTTLAFSQRASSNTVQVTCNSDWNINSNAEFTIPDTLEIKYNPNTDIVELVDQPYQIIKKVQESDDYVLALVRIGATQGNTHSQGDPFNRENYKDQKNAAGYSGRNLMYLLSKVDDKVFHRIVGRQWFRDGNATSQIQKGRKGQAQLFSADTLISKPGVKLGIMGCSIDVPKLRLYPLEAGKWGTSSKVDTNPATGRISFENGVPLGQRVFNPGLNISYSTNSYAIVGYILYKKKSTTQYLDVHGWQEVSNFALARYLGDRDFMYKQIGDRYMLTVKFSYGEP